ncbi:glycosyltransferase [Winogradskyella sp. A2]|uniref:glycosyltransferase n=1 Tax=Winogradskyella sp. A2 TaxID=3366944 RepID=UPI00398C261C
MKSNRIKIVFILPNLLPGGAERVVSFVADNLNRDLFESKLLIVGKSEDASYDLKNIDVTYLEKERVLKGILAIFKFLIKSKPNVVLTANTHLSTAVACLSVFFRSTKFISREVTLLSLDSKFFDKKKKRFNYMSFLNNISFNLFDKVISQSEDMKQDLIKNYNIKKENITVINNPISDSFSLKPTSNKNGLLKLITIGRLSKEKGIPRLLKILSKLDMPFHYTLIGDGPEKDTIFQLIDEYGLSEKITHINFTKNVSKYLSENDIFLQGSYFEGFPNCLIESCSVGTPVIAFDVPGGTKEIVINKVNGYLVDTEEEFLVKIKSKIIWNSSEIRESVLKKFNQSIILKKYENLFMEVINQ